MVEDPVVTNLGTPEALSFFTEQRLVSGLGVLYFYCGFCKVPKVVWIDRYLFVKSSLRAKPFPGTKSYMYQAPKTTLGVLIPACD